MVPDLERRIQNGALIKPVGRPQYGARAQERVPSDRDGGVVGGGRWGGGGSGGGGGGRGVGLGSAQVPADADGGLDHGAPAQEDVLRAVELGFARDFVAGFGLDVVAARGGAGFGRHEGEGGDGWEGGKGRVGREEGRKGGREKMMALSCGLLRRV